ncbi:hypothetical protein EAG_08942 [Camponotus floridanus]|uniref:Uncharacterized protein n=2 Tax=Camponotus floridanus TaxID=104421 RepID=E2AQM0_CAMFO|nr:hypothetical protein EAG_08942 [Camponotus floridanus]
MAGNDNHVAPKAAVSRAEDEVLYSDTAECKNVIMDNCDMKDKNTTNEEKEEEGYYKNEIKMDQAQGLQTTQMQAQVQQADTQAGR